MKYICPICQNETVKIEKHYENQGMDGNCENWFIYCKTCEYSRFYAADNFYGRKYLKNRDEVYENFCKIKNFIRN